MSCASRRRSAPASRWTRRWGAAASRGSVVSAALPLVPTASVCRYWWLGLCPRRGAPQPTYRARTHTCVGAVTAIMPTMMTPRRPLVHGVRREGRRVHGRRGPSERPRPGGQGSGRAGRGAAVCGSWRGGGGGCLACHAATARWREAAACARAGRCRLPAAAPGCFWSGCDCSLTTLRG